MYSPKTDQVLYPHKQLQQAARAYMTGDAFALPFGWEETVEPDMMIQMPEENRLIKAIELLTRETNRLFHAHTIVK